MLQSENDLTKEKEVNDFTVRVTYRPTDLLVYQEISGDTLDTARIAMLRKKYAHYYYFVLNLSKGSEEALHRLSGGQGQYSEVVQTLSFGMADHVTLTTSVKDTIPVGDFVLNRTYGMSNSTDLLFVFNRQKAKESEWIQFQLDEFGLGIGSQRFRFQRDLLDRAPGIDFKKLNSRI